MASYNRVIIIGNCCRDIELRYTPGGVAVAEMSLAVNDRYKGQNGEWVDDTTFVDVTFWQRNAEIAAEYLAKGSPVLIEGRLKQDKWDDKKTGEKRSKLKVVCERLQLLGTKGDGQRGGQRQGDAPRDEPQGGQYEGGGPPEDDNSIPF